MDAGVCAGCTIRLRWKGHPGRVHPVYGVVGEGTEGAYMAIALPVETVTECGSFVVGGEELRRLRKMVNLSIPELAERIHYSPSAISRWELGERRMHRRVWQQIMVVLLAEQQTLEEWFELVASFTAPVTAARITPLRPPLRK